MSDEQDLHSDDPGQLALLQAYLVLVDSKPKERGELARRYQVTITELEQVMAYFEQFVMQRSFWPENEIPKI